MPSAPQNSATHQNALWFDAARSWLGTDSPDIPEDGEGPLRRVRLQRFGIERFTVTNARFAEFVASTGYQTDAERFGWSHVFAGLIDKSHTSLTSVQTPWWVKVDGACWAHPEGPISTLEEREHHPVVHVSWNDAMAFAHWCGGRLPTEAEWEHAARGHRGSSKFPWGDDEPSDSVVYCNIWQGRFPVHNTCIDGYYGTAPVDAYTPNDAGLWNAMGNVWEWCSDGFRIQSLKKAAKARNAQALLHHEKVLKGGSFLCHRDICYRYRIAARIGNSPDSTSSNAGFRIAYSD